MAPVPGGQRLQPIRVIVANDTSIDAVVALSDTGKYVSVDVQARRHRRGRQFRRQQRRQRHVRRDALSKRLRDRAAQSDSAPDHRRPDPHLLLRRRFPAQGAARRFLRGALRRRRRDAGRRQPQRRAVRRAHRRRRSQEVLPLPVARRRHRRLLRRERKEREEVPGAQAGGRRHHALRLRHPPPSDPRLHQDAYRRRLGGADRHADLRLRQRHDRKGRLGIRLRQIYPHPPHQRLRDRLRPHERLCARHRGRHSACGKAR